MDMTHEYNAMFEKQVLSRGMDDVSRLSYSCLSDFFFNFSREGYEETADCPPMQHSDLSWTSSKRTGSLSREQTWRPYQAGRCRLGWKEDEEENAPRVVKDLQRSVQRTSSSEIKRKKKPLITRAIITIAGSGCNSRGFASTYKDGRNGT